MTRTWDIFCSVVDNYGDVGVCWRLARQLATELDQTVRFWVDELASFHRICHAVDPARSSQLIERVEVRRWDAPFARVDPADIVIEGFGARVAAAYLEAMVARSPRPLWINLEYLSAERWVEGCHKLPSPHPQLPLVKYFFFPGFTVATGGLLVERGLAQARAAFQDGPSTVARFWQAIGVAMPANHALSVSLFCYANAALAGLVDAWRNDSSPVACVVPGGSVLAQLQQITGQAIAPGSCVRLGTLSIHAIPFLELDQYDRLLWACDLNFVRGEDSFVRAQLAARPLIWQAYAQAEGAHLLKEAAFLDRYLQSLNGGAGAALRAFSNAWNCESPDAGRLWSALHCHRKVLAMHSAAWAKRLTSGPGLANELAKFCEDRLK